MAGRVLARFFVREGLLAGLPNMPGADKLRRGDRNARGLLLGWAAPADAAHTGVRLGCSAGEWGC